MTYTTANLRTEDSALLRTNKQCLGIVVASLLTLCSGQVLGHSATLLPQLRTDPDFQFDDSYSSLIAAITPLFMVLGCLFAGSIMDILGRKVAQICLSFVFLSGSLVIGFATNNIFLLVGRALSGIVTGAVRPIALVYIGEVMDPKYRSLALIFPSVTLCLGIILTHTLGGYVHWRTNCFISCAPSTTCCILSLFLKESPIWLISKGRTEQGAEVFKWFRGDGEVAMKELNEIIEKRNQKEDKSLVKEVFGRKYLMPLLIISLLGAGNQVCGVNVLSFYAQEMLEKTFPGKIDAFKVMMVIDLMRLSTTMAIFFLGKILPRRRSYLFITFGTSASLLMLVAYLYINPAHMVWLSVGLFLLYTSFASATVCLGWSFMPELFPSAFRGLCCGFASALSFFMLFINVKITPGIMKNYGDMSLYAGYGILTFVNTFILYFILPETNGRSLQDIEDSYSKQNDDIVVSRL